jgi:TolB protein
VTPLFTVAVAPFYDLTSDGSGAEIAERAPELLRGLLESTVFFRTLPPERHPEETIAEGWTPATVGWWRWAGTGAFALVKGTVTFTPPGVPVLRIYLYETETGAAVELPTTELPVTLAELRTPLEKWSDELVRHYTGRPGILSSRIAYARRDREPGGAKEIWVVGMDGRDERPVTSNGSLNMLPAWAPDGRIAYTTYVEGNPDVAIEGEPFSAFPGLNTGVEWSPDGEVAAISLSKDDNSEIYLLDGRTGEIRERLTTHPGIDSSPTFSPDGARIAFTSDRAGVPQVWVMNRDGSDPRCLTPFCGYCTSPAWSPSGALIAYNAMVGQGIFDVYAVDVDAGSVRRLTSGRGSNEEPTWSPDGRYLAFSSSRNSVGRERRQEIFLLPVSGGEAVQLTHGEQLYYNPAWSR